MLQTSQANLSGASCLLLSLWDPAFGRASAHSDIRIATQTFGLQAACCFLGLSVFQVFQLGGRIGVLAVRTSQDILPSVSQLYHGDWRVRKEQILRAVRSRPQLGNQRSFSGSKVRCRSFKKPAPSATFAPNPPPPLKRDPFLRHWDTLTSPQKETKSHNGQRVKRVIFGCWVNELVFFLGHWC